MKITLSGPRSLAISIVAGAMGWLMWASDSADTARYPKMSRDALVAELVHKQPSAAAILSVCLFIVLFIVIGVDVLTNFFDAVWRRISPPDGSAPPAV